MNVSPLILFLYFFTFSLFVLSSCEAQTHTTDVEDEVWTQEENYWKFLKANDFENFLKLWDANFIGWSSGGQKPIRKGDIENVLKGNSGSLIDHYELTREGIQIFDDVAITHFKVYQEVTQNNTKVRETVKVTHTWRKVNGSWVILGGMAALFE